MAENSKIEWTDHTFNPWIGCTKVSPGCVNCYAETLMDTRYKRVKWGKGQPRVRTSAANWKLPLKWDRDAKYGIEQWHRTARIDGMAAGIPPRRPRVFCASLADWLDDEVPIEWLADLLDLIRRTPNLDWLLLTKRPENWRARLVSVMEWVHHSGQSARKWWDAMAWIAEWLNGNPPANVWIGTTVEDQQRADERIPHLLRIPARVRFLSCEPLLGHVDLYNHFHHGSGGEYWPEGTLPNDAVIYGYRDGEPLYRRGIHWVICGGESGPSARPMHPDWARSLRDQCKAAGVPFLFKQWGEWADYGDAVDRAIEGVRRADNERIVNLAGGHGFHGERPMVMARIGKVRAGRILDGVEHNEFPNANA